MGELNEESDDSDEAGPRLIFLWAVTRPLQRKYLAKMLLHARLKLFSLPPFSCSSFSLVFVMH